MAAGGVRVAIWSEDGTIPATVAAAVARHPEVLRWADPLMVGDPGDAEGTADVVVVGARWLEGRDADGAGDPARGVRLLLLAERVTPRLRHLARRRGVHGLVGGRPAPEVLAAALADLVAHGSIEIGGDTAAEQPAWPGRAHGLSERESQVLVLCAEGLTNREIADRLYLNVETVKSHLKRVYQRLGVRNRAEAVAFVHRVDATGSFRPLDWSNTTSRRAEDVAPVRDFADDRRVDLGALATRRSLLGMPADDTRTLRRYVPAALAQSDAYLEGLVARWRAEPRLAAVLDRDDVVVRLVEHHRRYVGDLFGGRDHTAHTKAMLRTGATHHRLGIEPQWYVASFAHVVCEHLPILFAGAPTAVAIDDACTLVTAVLADACLGLDAYELSVAAELLDERDGPAHRGAAAVFGAGTSGAVGDAHEVPRRAVTKLAVDEADVARRRRLVGLDDDTIGVLQELSCAVAGAAPRAVRDFYDFVTGDPQLTTLVPASAIDRLMVLVEAYWEQLAASAFDDAHAASRVRIGVIHERIGVSPQLYLAGLSRQLGAVLRSVAAASHDPCRAVDALVRAVFFDVAFVIDAYLDARIETMLDAERFAGHLVANLATAVAVVDERDRVQYANEQLLAHVDVPAGALHRMPVQDALRIDGVLETVEAARRSPTRRASSIVDDRGRRVRVTGVALQRTGTRNEALVAVVVDDLTEVLRASTETGREDRRLADVLHAVGAFTWEIDRDRSTVIAISRVAEHVAGWRDVDILGSSAWLERIPRNERDALARALAALDTGARTHLVHGLHGPDGTVVQFHTSMLATVDPTGRRTVCGVSVRLDAADPDTAS